jgi:excisionase family DNA binding protein
MNATLQQIAQLMERPTVNVEEAAMVLGIGRGQAYRAVNSGELRCVRIGKRVIVPTSALRELLDGQSAPAA